MTEDQLRAEILKAADEGRYIAMEQLMADWERTFSPRARRAAALRNLDVEIGRAFLSIPLVRWIFRKAGLTPKEKYRDA